MWVKRWSFSWLTEAGVPDVHWVNPSQYAWRNGASLETLCTAIRREWKICCINIVGMRWFVELWFAQYRASNDIDRRRFLWELNQLKSSSHILLLHRYEKQIRQCTSYPKKHSKRKKFISFWNFVIWSTEHLQKFFYNLQIIVLENNACWFRDTCFTKTFVARVRHSQVSQVSSACCITFLKTLSGHSKALITPLEGSSYPRSGVGN